MLSNDIDLLHPPAELEKRKHKLKRLVQSPNSFFMVIISIFFFFFGFAPGQRYVVMRCSLTLVFYWLSNELHPCCRVYFCSPKLDNCLLLSCYFVSAALFVSGFHSSGRVRLLDVSRTFFLRIRCFGTWNYCL